MGEIKALINYREDDKLFFSLTRMRIKYPPIREPRMVNTVSINTYSQPKYEIMTGRRNGLIARLLRKMAIKSFAVFDTLLLPVNSEQQWLTESSLNSTRPNGQAAKDGLCDAEHRLQRFHKRPVIIRFGRGSQWQ